MQSPTSITFLLSNWGPTIVFIVPIRLRYLKDNQGFPGHSISLEDNMACPQIMLYSSNRLGFPRGF